MFYYFLASLCIVFTFFFSTANTDILDVYLFNAAHIPMPYTAICIFSFIMGALTSLFLAIRSVLDSKKNLANVKRKLEKTAVGADDSDLKVKTLENKVKTLEAALAKSVSNEE